MTYDYSPQLKEVWLLYLRKSRQDDPNETVEEVLSKHETMLQEFAERELGERIPEENIYREVVSGESIEDRDEIKKILVRIEEPNVAGVLVMEPSRLSRGDLSDCAKIIDSFRFTHTLVATPMMTYNLEKKMERKFFQDELLRGNDYLEYTKEILFRGRVAAAKRGCYIGPHPPYGYDRIKIGRDWTLEPNSNADAVRLAFGWYTKDGLSPKAIARRLADLGYSAPQGGAEWARETVLGVLTNVHYIGKIKFNEYKHVWVVENGKRIKKRVRQAEEDVIISEGKHQALIDVETFEAVKARMATHPRIRDERELVNPLAGVLRCAKCGRSLILERHLEKPNVAPRYKCRRNQPSCLKSAKAAEVLEAVIVMLEHSELPRLEKLMKEGAGESIAIQKRRIAELVKQMEEYKEQEETQYELLEQKKYTQALFDRRNAALREKMEACEKALYVARAAMPADIDYSKKVLTLKQVVADLKNPDMTPLEQNKSLKRIVERIDMDTFSTAFNRTELKLRITLMLE